MKTTSFISGILVVALIIVIGFRIPEHSSPIRLYKTELKAKHHCTADEKIKLLCNRVWMVKETIQNLNCGNVFYQRDKVNTTGYDQGVLRIYFNEDGTGYYIDCYGKKFASSWQFLNEEANDLRLNINGLLSHDWHMVVINDDYMMETTAIEGVGLVTAQWIPEEALSNKFASK